MSLNFARNTSFYSNVLKLTFLLFIFTNCLLFYYLYQRDENKCVNNSSCQKNKNRRILSPENWGQTIFSKVLFKYYRRIDNEWRLAQNTSVEKSIFLNCSSLQRIENLKFIAFGWTKTTFKATLDNQTLSVKTVNINGHDVSSCLREADRYLQDCYLLAATKLLKEIALLQTMTHENVVKMLGYCVPVNPDVQNPYNTVAILEEYGEPINVIKLLQLPWEERLRISLGLSRLLKHLASFQEPIALNDFRRQQFVVVNGEPKLIDVDDVGFQEPQCNSTSCCQIVPVMDNMKVCAPCIKNKCHGYNEKMNIIRTGRHFIKHILPHGTPASLSALAIRLTTAFQTALLDANGILKEMERLTALFKSGSYRNISQSHFLTGYKIYSQRDVSPDFDYRCQLTVSGYGCTFSIFDAEEAAEICWSDSNCKAFILTNVTTWTGRKIVHLKNGTGKLLVNNATTLFVKL